MSFSGYLFVKKKHFIKVKNNQNNCRLTDDDDVGCRHGATTA